MKMPAIVCIILMCLCASCSSYPKYYPYSFKPDLARNVNSVALAPLDLFSPLPPRVRDKDAVVYDAVKAHLGGHGVSCKPALTIKAIWEEEIKKAGGIYSPANGELLKDKYTICLRNTVTRVCAIESVQAVVFPEIVVRKAFLEHTTLYWDGTEQRLDNADPNLERYSGNSTALSLRIIMIDKDNRLMLKNIAGIECPVKVVREGGSVRNLKNHDNILTDKAKIGHAVALGFHPFIPYPEYPANPSFSEN